jgi:hypothetical protein
VNSAHALIKRAFRILSNKIGGINNSQVILTGLRMDPEVDTEKSGNANLATGLFKGLALGSLFRSFSAFDMATGLIDHDNAGRAFFDNKKLAVLFNDG